MHSMIDIWLADRPLSPKARIALRTPKGPIAVAKATAKPASIDPAA